MRISPLGKRPAGALLFAGLSVATILKATQPVKTNKHIIHLSTLKGTDEDEEVLHIAIEDPERTGKQSSGQECGEQAKECWAAENFPCKLF